MRDIISIPRLAMLHPTVRDKFKVFIESAETGLGLTLRIVQGFRTFAEQSIIYDQGRTTSGKIVTWSPAGTSYHNYGLAIDVVPIVGTVALWNYDYSKLRAFGAAQGITWGGDFPVGKKDRDHFECIGNLNWRELLHKYQIKDFVSGSTIWVNI